MAKKKRQLRWLLILLAVVVLLFAAGVIWNQMRAAQEEAEAEATIIPVDLVEEPTQLRYCDGTDTFSFEKSGETWVSKDEVDFPLDSDSMDSFVEILTELTAERELDITDTLDAYGLKDPKQWVEVTDKAGNCATLYLGGATGEGYYAQKKGGETIYTIQADVQTELSRTLYDRASLAQFPTLASSNIKTVTLQGELTSKLEVRGVEVESEQDSEDSSAASSAGDNSAEETEPEVEYHWYLTGDVDVTTEGYLSELRTELTSLSFDSLADFQPKSLKAYGLDEPTASVKITYQEDNRKQTVTLELGKETTDADGTACRYAMFNGDKTEVYRISLSKVEHILAGAQKGYAQASADDTEAQTEGVE